MEALQHKIIIYSASSGSQPFLNWLKNISDQRAVRKIEARIARVRLGNFGDSKAVGEGVIELRINHGPGYRIYFARDNNVIVILWCGGDKSTQSKDIELAKLYLKHYWENKNEK